MEEIERVGSLWLVCYSDFHNSVWLSYHSKALEEHKVVEEEGARGQQRPPHVSERLWLIHTWQRRHMTQSLKMHVEPRSLEVREVCLSRCLSISFKGIFWVQQRLSCICYHTEFQLVLQTNKHNCDYRKALPMGARQCTWINISVSKISPQNLSIITNTALFCCDKLKWGYKSLTELGQSDAVADLI